MTDCTPPPSFAFSSPPPPPPPLPHPLSSVLPSCVLVSLFPHWKDLKCCGLDKHSRLGTLYRCLHVSLHFIKLEVGGRGVRMGLGVEKSAPQHPLSYTTVACRTLTVRTFSLTLQITLANSLAQKSFFH